MTGGSITLIGSGAVVVAADDIEPGLRDLLVAAVSVEDCLGAIVAALSANVRSLPSLVCAIREPEGVRILLRGAAEAVVTTAAGEQRIAPGSVSTWAEHLIPDAASLVLRHAPGGSPAILPGGPRVGVGAGVSSGPVEAAAPAAPAAPLAAAAPVTPPVASPPAPPAASPPAPPAASPPAATDGLALASSTLAWLGDGSPNGAIGQEAGEPAAEPLPPSADAPDEALDGLGDPTADEPDPPAAGTAEVDDPFGFRHLLDETMHVSTEEAAVRPPPEDHEEDEPAPAPPPAEPVAAEPAEPEPPAEPAIPLPVMTGGGLIDSVPGSSSHAAAPLVSAAPAGAGPAPSYAAPAAAATPAPKPLGGPGAPFASTASRPPVQAVLCDLGHPNPVMASECRTCRHPLLDRTPRSVPRPSLGRLVFTDGMVAELDSPVLIGRAPAESMAAPDLRETPKLLSLPSQDKRISRLHAEIRLEGWQVYVLDSSSLNGTTVMQPGLPPRQLRSGEPCLIDPGTSVNLGGAVTFTFEGPTSR